MKRRGGAVTAIEVEEPGPDSERTARDRRFARMAAVAGAYKAFRPASEALTAVRAVPTIFPQFDRATRVGGLPIERFTLVHGSSTGGKTYYCIAMMLSFLMRDHPVFFIDAERTTPHAWLRMAMGDYADHPLFRAVKPQTYEQTRKDVREFMMTTARLRDAGKLPPDTSALVVLDSIRKLVPKDQFKQIMQLAKSDPKDDQARSRIAQIKAQMNAAWLDELVVLLDETSTAMIAIAREMVDPGNTNPKAIRFGTNVKTAGGSALFYDASLDVRSSRVGSYGKRVKGPDGQSALRAFGDVHRLDITKSKVSGKEEYRASCPFHISNGVWVPAGFDRGRDLLELARSLDVVSGTSSLAHGKRTWRNEHLAAKALTEDADLFAAVEAECRALFRAPT